MAAPLEALTARAAMLQNGTFKLVERVPDEQLRRRLAPTAPPMLFHVWHMARWADRVQARVSAILPATRPGQPEIWIADRLAEAWKIETPLGTFDSGMEMGDEANAALVLPSTRTVIEYAHRAYDAVGRVIGAAREEDLALRGKDIYDRESTVATMLVAHLTHQNRHLGMIEALAGVMGESGTASV